MLTLKGRPALQDNTPVELNADQKKRALDEIGKAYHALKHLQDLITSGRITVSTRVAAMGCVEFNLSAISEAIGYEGDLQKEREERYVELRAANTEIRRLEALVGSNKPMEGLSELLSSLTKNVHDFWCNELSLGLVYDSPVDSREHGGIGAGYGNAYYEATLTCHFDSIYRGARKDFSKKPVSDEAEHNVWFEEMKEKLDLFIEDNHYASMKDTPKNRKWITDQLVGRFPSLQVIAWEIHQAHRSEEFVIQSIRIRIKNLQDMKNDSKD